MRLAGRTQPRPRFLVLVVLRWRLAPPLLVEPVAWVSARPLALFALSFSARTPGLVLPLVLMALHVHPLRRVGGRPSAGFGPAARALGVEEPGFGLLGPLAIPMA